MDTVARSKWPLSFYEPYTIGEQPHRLAFVPGRAAAVQHAVKKKYRGSYSELIASAWLLENEYEVFRNVCDRGPVDLIALKDGQLHLIDVKTVQVLVTKAGDAKIMRRGPVLTKEQEDLGVRALYVTPEGLCDWHTARLQDVYNEINSPLTKGSGCV